MKKLLLLLGVSLLSVCCQRRIGDGEFVFLHSFIIEYMDVEFKLAPWVGVDGRFAISFSSVNSENTYRAPEVGGEGASAEKFLEIAERNQDRTYDREDTWQDCELRSCSVDDITAFRVVCPEGAWDSDHPAGSSLNDLIKASFSSYGEYVRNGYNGVGRKYYEKPLSEVTVSDLHLLEVRSLGLVFPRHPARGTYTLEVTIIMASGKEIVTTCEAEFK